MMFLNYKKYVLYRKCYGLVCGAYDFEFLWLILMQLLVGLVTSFRYVGDEINAKLAQSEAEILHEAVKEKKGSHEEAIRILTTRSKIQLIATFNRYRETHGTSITKVQNRRRKKGDTINTFISLSQITKNCCHILKCAIQNNKKNGNKKIQILLFIIYHLNFNPFYLFCRNCWMKDLMNFRRHCTLPFVASMTTLSTMKRLNSHLLSATIIQQSHYILSIEI